MFIVSFFFLHKMFKVIESFYLVTSFSWSSQKLGGRSLTGCMGDEARCWAAVLDPPPGLWWTTDPADVLGVLLLSVLGALLKGLPPPGPGSSRCDPKANLTIK